MKLAHTFFLGILGILLRSTRSSPIEDFPVEGGRRIIRRCEDIPLKAYLHGELIVDGHIDCTDANFKWIVVSAHSVIRAFEGAAIKITNVVWIVDPGVHLSFVAPTVTLDRTKGADDRLTLIYTQGLVEFFVNGWQPSHVGGSLVDDHELVDEADGGRVSSPQGLHFFQDSIVAMDPVRSPDGDTSILPPQPPLVPPLVAVQWGTLDAMPGSRETSAVSAGGRNTISEVTQRSHHAINKVDHDSAASAGGESDGIGGADQNLQVDSAASLPWMQAHPAPALKVGERLTGSLHNSHGTAMTYASPFDGSIMLARSTGGVQSKKPGGSAGSEPENVQILVHSNSKWVARVIERRADIDVERKEKERVAAGGRRRKGVELRAAAMGWLPFGKAGFIERKKREHAKAHLGEVEMHVTNRGKLEATIDGTRVLSKAGPSFFGYRAKDSSFEYRTTEDGFEVLRRGNHVWGVVADRPER
ncbi:unnamed protein product [Scytosiphon promiscuus]